MSINNHNSFLEDTRQLFRLVQENANATEQDADVDVLAGGTCEVAERILRKINNEGYVNAGLSCRFMQAEQHCKNFSATWDLIKFIPTREETPSVELEALRLQRKEVIEELKVFAKSMAGALVLLLVLCAILGFLQSMSGSDFGIAMACAGGVFGFGLAAYGAKYAIKRVFKDVDPFSSLDKQYKTAMTGFLKKFLEILSRPELASQVSDSVYPQGEFYIPDESNPSEFRCLRSPRYSVTNDSLEGRANEIYEEAYREQENARVVLQEATRSFAAKEALKARIVELQLQKSLLQKSLLQKSLYRTKSRPVINPLAKKTYQDPILKLRVSNSFQGGKSIPTIPKRTEEEYDVFRSFGCSEFPSKSQKPSVPPVQKVIDIPSLVDNPSLLLVLD